MEPTTIIQARKELQASKTVRKALLVCGILSSLLYVGTDVLGAMRWEGYSYTDQTISELGAIGAPSRPLVFPLFIMYDVLLIAFGLCIWGLADQKRALRVTAGLPVGIAVIGLVSTFFPMHLREAEKILNGTMHAILFGVIVLFILLAIGFGATAFGKWFRPYSIGMLVILLVIGVLSFLRVPQAGANQPTPWLGVMERINAYGYLLWVLVLAIVLLREEKRAGASR